MLVYLSSPSTDSDPGDSAYRGQGLKNNRMCHRAGWGGVCVQCMRSCVSAQTLRELVKSLQTLSAWLQAWHVVSVQQIVLESVND